MCIRFLQISISSKRGVLVRFTMGTPYILNIDEMKSGWLGIHSLSRKSAIEPT